jgi:acetyl-CoA C-acetyltransferase
MLEAYLYDGLRTPIGRHAGGLAKVRPDDLAAGVIRRLMERSPFRPEQIEDVLLGCACQAGEDSRNVGRHAALVAGLPVEVAGQTVNRLCGSGMAAIIDASRAITLGEGSLFLAGGVESMSRAPFVMGKAESPYSRDMQVFDTTIGARFPNSRLVAQYGNDSMPETADNVARDLGLSREASDRFALASQQKTAKAKAEGFYDGEIIAVEVPAGRNKPPVVVTDDEHVRPDTTYESLAKLRSLAPNGVVTAGNASGINDGAAVVVVGSREIGDKAGAQPIARIRAAAVAGVPPRVMGLGPVPASQKALQRAGITLKDLDVIEINEAFAVQVLGCCAQLGLDAEDSRLNPNGGAIALGHPLGCSGGRLVLTAARQLQRIKGRFALVTMCIGVGQGIAAVIERV